MTELSSRRAPSPGLRAFLAACVERSLTRDGAALSPYGREIVAALRSPQPDPAASRIKASWDRATAAYNEEHFGEGHHAR